MREDRDRPAILNAVLLLFAVAVTSAAAADAQAKQARLEQSAGFFADRAVRVFRIDLSESALAILERSPRTYVSATVRAGALVLTNVALHLKGMGSFRPLDDKPSLVLNFDKFAAAQEYCGLTRLQLNNSVQDSSYVAEALAASLFRDAGVPAARVTHARVILNGRDLGLYTAVEAMNKRFLKQWFKDGSGNLYEGYLQDIHEPLELDNGTNRMRADVERLLHACQIVEPAQRFQQLSQVLDVERFVSFAAMEMLIAHWDGYTMKSNNFRLYHDPSTDKMVFIPHGMDATFRRLNVPVTPPMRSIVSSALFQTPEGRRLYEARLQALYTNVFRLETITNCLADSLAKLRAANLPAAQEAAIARQCGVLQSRIVQRIARVRDQLAGIPPKALEFDAAGLAHPEGWRDELDRGEPVHDQVQVGEQPALHIKAAGAQCRRRGARAYFYRLASIASKGGRAVPAWGLPAMPTCASPAIPAACA